MNAIGEVFKRGGQLVANRSLLETIALGGSISLRDGFAAAANAAKVKSAG